MKTIKGTITPALAFLLALLMLFYVLPADVYGAIAEGSGTDSAGTEEKEAEALFELTELRSAETKYILMSDGTIQALVYDTAVHVQDENGVWQDMDNSLTEGNTTVDSARVKFAKKISGNGELFTLHEGNRKVTLSLSGAIEKTPITVVSDGKATEKAVTRLEELSTLFRVASSVRYEGILPGTDVEYVLTGNDLKENIVIHRNLDSYTYTFLLSLNHLTAVQQEDGSIGLLDGAETVYTMPAPFMYDADGRRSDAVSYTLTPANGTGKYTLTVTADGEWINASDRAFPVTVDPTVSLGGSNATNGSVSSEGGVYSYYMNAGVSDGVSYRSYISFTLPALPDGSRVTGATLKLYQDGYHKDTADTVYIAARRVNTSWSASALRWGNQPEFESTVLDFAETGASETGKRLSFDLTAVYREWMNGTPNYGILLGAEGEDRYGGYVQLGGTGFPAAKQPILEVTFRNQKGLEDRYTYQVMSVGNAGNLYLCDYSLEKTVVKTLADTYAGSVSLVYNSVGAASLLPSDRLQIAQGWSLSADRTISLLENPSGYVLYTDEDGTGHYYAYDSGNGFIGEDDDPTVIYLVGLNVLSVDLSVFSAYNSAYAALETDEKTYLMVGENGEKTLFYNGIAVAAADEEGNLTEYHYNESTPSSSISLPTASSRVITSVYNIEKTEDGYGEAELCVKIEKNGSDTVLTVAGEEEPYVLSVNDQNDLCAIKRSTSENASAEAEYLYGEHGLTDLCDNETDYGVRFFKEGMDTFCEYHKDSTVSGGKQDGKKILFTGGGTATTYLDGSRGSDNALLAEYRFDRTGRTVCVYTHDFLMNTYSTALVEYDQAVSSSSARSDIYTSTGGLSVNRFFDGSLEGGSTHTFQYAVYSTEQFRSGTRSMAASSAATAPRTTVSLQANQTYTLSAYVNLEETTGATTGGGAYLELISPQGVSVTSQKLLTRTGSADKWQRLFVTFTAAETGNYTLYLRCRGLSGYVYFDDIQLETGAVTGGYSYIPNGAVAEQDGWTFSDSKVTCAQATTPESSVLWPSVKIEGEPGADRYFSRNVKVNPSGKSYLLTGWAKAASASLKEGRSFELRAQIVYTDGTTEEAASFSFNSDIRNSWQFASGRVTADENKTVAYITVSGQYSRNTGTAWFTNLSLVECDSYIDSTDQSADDSGETDAEKTEPSETTVTVAQLCAALGMTQTELQSYAGSESLTGEITCTVAGEESTGVYTKVYTGARISAAVTQDQSDESSRSWYTFTLSVYDEEDNLVCTVDSLGGVTRYTYDEEGNVSSETSALNATTAYTYGEGLLVKAEIANKAKVEYSYTGRELTGAVAGLGSATQGYTFLYNAYGKLTEVRAGDYPLVTYAYDADGTNLTAVSYSNGLTVSYGYDILDRVVEICYNGSTRYTYRYTDESALLSVKDHLTGEEKVYNTEGHTSSVLTLDANRLETGAFYAVTDEEGRTVSVREYTVQNSALKEQSYSYTYDGEGRLTGMQAGGQSLAYAYDALGRVTSETSSVLTKSYAYRTVNGRTCDLVSTLSYTKANGTSLLSLSYEYDAAGNITKVYKSGVVYNQYAYDELGQLIREDNKDANKSYTYTYDSRGNILEKKTYAFTLGTLGTVQSTHTYGYATDSWKDRLTSYNGSTITYDAIGNPLTYNNGSAYTFTWEGRQMQTATKGNTTWTYTYNADGLRIGKTNGTTTYTYTWNDGKLTSQTWGNSYMLFYYNAEGKPLYVEYHDANDECSGTYYYVLNLQGDTVALYDPARNITAVNYEYDAWGRELSWSTYDSGYAGLIFNNPLTYRGYIYDSETGFYYLQSRYYDPTIGRFLNADDTAFLGASGTLLSWNLFGYCENNFVNKIDETGLAAINVIFAAVGAIVGWLLGDFVAKELGYRSGWKYWAIRVGVVAGSAVIGWFAGNLMAKIIATYLKSHISVVFKLTNKLGATAFYSAMKFLGIDPFSLSMDRSIFIGIVRLFNTKAITISYDWAINLYKMAKNLGFKISLDVPHNGYTWHIHISGANGKLRNLHVQIVKAAWDYLSKLLQ